MSGSLTAIGLMSGTSMDGIDAALIETDGERQVSLIASHSIPCSARLGELLRRSIEGASRLQDRVERPEPMNDAEREVTAIHALAVDALLAKSGMMSTNVNVVGFHGQTILHRPERGLTVQLGDGAELARTTGIDVVSDFRANDMAHGGEGAPLAPVYHRALAGTLSRMPVAFLNLGGVANVTWVGPDDSLVAFDTGPANGLIDQWMQARSGSAMDTGGAHAARGTVDGTLLARLLEHPYFERNPPKSLDRFDFGLELFAGLGVEDGAATLTAFTAASVALATVYLPKPPQLWIACGGGRHNATLMDELAGRLSAPVCGADDVGLRGDSMEAEAFAYMAVRSLKGLPLSFPGTTGVMRPVSGGVLHRAG